MENSICYSLYLLMYCLYTIKYCTRCIGGNVLTWFYLICLDLTNCLTGFSIFNISIMAVVNIHARYNYCNTLHSRGNNGNRNRIRYIWRTYQIHPTLLYVEYKAPMINNLLVVVVRGLWQGNIHRSYPLGNRILRPLAQSSVILLPTWSMFVLFMKIAETFDVKEEISKLPFPSGKTFINSHHLDFTSKFPVFRLRE